MTQPTKSKKSFHFNILNQIKEVAAIKGYYTSIGYMGYVASENKYILFSSEADYIDYIT